MTVRVRRSSLAIGMAVLCLCATAASARADTRGPEPQSLIRNSFFGSGGPPLSDLRTTQARSFAESLVLPPVSLSRTTPTPTPTTTTPTTLSTTPVPTSALTPGQQCLLAIRAAERASGIPDHLLAAIARVESGRADADGVVSPWPWSINAEGADHIFESKAAAVAGVLALQARGVRSIDVGCLQVNLMHHPGAFPTLEEAFDPILNANYAAHFLTDLFAQTGSWERATAAYHSMTPGLGDPYQRKVASVLPQERARGDVDSQTALPGAVAGSGAIMLGNRPELARLLPATGGLPGRGLDRYRQVPIPIASRTALPRPG